MFEPSESPEPVIPDRTAPVALGRPWDLIVGGTGVWLDGDPVSATAPTTAGTGDYAIDFDPTPVIDALRAEMAAHPYEGIDTDELTEAAMALAALEAGVRVQQLCLIAELDARDAWKPDGQTGMVAWICLVFATRKHTARELLGVARALPALPAITVAYTEGRLAWDQLVPLCQLATADTDTDWAEDAPGYSAEDLASMVRNKRLTDDEARDAHDRRGVRRRDPRGGLTEHAIQLPHADSAVVENALDAEADRNLVRDPDTGLYPSRAQQLADALVSICAKYLGGDGEGQPGLPTVVVHADLDLCTGENPDGYAALVDGRPIARTTLARLLAEGHIEWAIHGPDGTQLGIGRASKIWPPWLARIIRQRDGGRCRFPGCRGPIHHLHHITEWVADLGPTSSSNGMAACYSHHHLVHEGGWTVTGDANTTLTYTSPTGRTLTSRPAHLTPALKRRLAQTSNTNFDDLY